MLISLFFLWPAISAGQIFRYQDEFGIWHFTDDPPQRYESSIVPDIATSKTDSPDSEPKKDLAALLKSTFNPTTPISYATLAVVAIKTDYGEGSGFFCSEKGHILTNRHVVRPSLREDLNEQRQALNEKELELQTTEGNLKEARNQLRLMKKDLNGYEELIVNAKDEKTISWAKKARQHLIQRSRVEREKIAGMKRNIRRLKSRVRDSKWKVDSALRFATAKQRFAIVLKDETELVAKLVEVSDEQDLALLKLNGYRTPFLRFDLSGSLSQGIQVFAIGNPLGMQDAVTSGVVTQVAEDHLLTDAQVLPGSSGGPLIRESGEVIGINVSRKVAAGTSKYAAGFGKAIPIALAIRAFPHALASSEIQTATGTPATRPTPIQFRSFRSGWPASADTGPDARVRSDPTGTADSAPIRLIISDEDRAPSLDEPADREPRSLDFPPEGSWDATHPGTAEPQQ